MVFCDDPEASLVNMRGTRRILQVPTHDQRLEAYMRHFMETDVRVWNRG